MTWTTTTYESNGVLHLSCAETAKAVRAALKRAFPTTKFSVRSSHYSMGASIDVTWTDGPTSKQVDAVVKVYEGAGFDGMIDMKYHKEHWMEPDGTVHLAQCDGTEGSRGYVPETITDPPSANARLVRFGADYVMGQRSLSPEVVAQVEAEIAEVTGQPFPKDAEHRTLLPWRTFVDDDGTVLLSHCEWDQSYASNLVWQVGCQRDYSK